MSKIAYVIQNKSGSNGSYNCGEKQFTILPGEIVRLDDKPTGNTVNVTVSRIIVKDSQEAMKPLNMIPVDDKEEAKTEKETKEETTPKKK